MASNFACEQNDCYAVTASGTRRNLHGNLMYHSRTNLSLKHKSIGDEGADKVSGCWESENTSDISLISADQFANI
jgi:hypothetical protein